MPHYYSEDQKSALRLDKITIKLKTITFEVYSASGVFSKRKLDRGTDVFLHNLIIKDGWRVLDIGCGNGIVGIALKKLNPKIGVVMSDINKRAVMLAKKNVKMHQLDNQVVRSDLFEKIAGKFDTILSNPPQHAGKDVCFAIIQQALKFLKKGGLLQIVARHNKGGKTLEEEMQRVFGNVKEIAKKSGFRVYLSKKENV